MDNNLINAAFYRGKKTFLFSKTVFALIGLAEYFEKTEDSFFKL